ncbi:substrate-binding domain-containing protein [Conexibacter arvalis]|uniref:Simple sugar transport system substrate-binding protein n=1 Tax=Conexibacter arvalis TaxID=912552 RepID=A0A840IET2_9ACTN|nr:substrate-binding domain-containing protein [Conexibacter arvalis]MBB4662825.1 simple sugar transport system substrate-binding protein [Conexibacter arvalis]
MRIGTPGIRRTAAAIASVALLAGVAGCGSSDDGGSAGTTSGGAPDELRVGAMFLDSQGFYGGVKYGFEQAAERDGVKLRLTQSNAGGDASAESSFISTLASSKPDAIVVSAVSETASVPAIRLAARSGIPVICYNTCIRRDALEEHVFAYAVGDPVEFGAMLGEAAADYFEQERNDAPKIGVVNCEQFEVCKLRRQGFEEALGRRIPGAEIVANQSGTTEDKAISVAQNMLNANRDIDAFFGESGGATAGAVKAVEAAKRVGDVVVFGSDMTTELARELLDGRILKADVDISGRTMGETAYRLVLDAASGREPADKIVPVPIRVFRADRPAEVEEWLKVHANGLP